MYIENRGSVLFAEVPIVRYGGISLENGVSFEVWKLRTWWCAFGEVQNFATISGGDLLQLSCGIFWKMENEGRYSVLKILFILHIGGTKNVYISSVKVSWLLKLLSGTLKANQ